MMMLTISLPPLTPTPARPLFLNGVLDATTINVWYHTALYSCVLFSGAVDVLVDAGHMPQKADAIVHILAALCEAMLFASHLGGKCTA